MTRPCERTLVMSTGQRVTPEDINTMASGGSTFARFILHHRDHITIEDVIALAEAISDNWLRYTESC